MAVNNPHPASHPVTRADLVPAARDEDTALIGNLLVERAGWKARAQEALAALEAANARHLGDMQRVAEALGLPHESTVGRIVDEIWKLR